VYGDDLVQSLVDDIMRFQRKGEGGTRICERLHEIANVALSDSLKQWAQEHLVEECDREQ